jgi:hypothetical protein
MAPMAREQLLELLDPKRSVKETDIVGLLKFDKAIEITKDRDDHKSSPSIKKLIDMLETHRQRQESNIEGSFSKMEESLSSKKQLNDEISQFEVKQRAMLNITMTVIIIVLVLLVFCFYWYKNKKSSVEQLPKSADVEPWEVYGTEEEKKTKREKMTKLQDTLFRMDDEVVRLRKDLEELKSK